MDLSEESKEVPEELEMNVLSMLFINSFGDTASDLGRLHILKYLFSQKKQHS